MKHFHVKLEGIEPFYFTAPSTIVPKKGDKEAEIKKAYDMVRTNDAGHIGIKSRMLVRCFQGSVQHLKIKVEGSVKRAVDIMNSSVFLINPRFVVFKPERTIEDVEIVQHNMVTQGPKPMLIHPYYARLVKKWGLEFDLHCPDIFQYDQLFDIIENAGVFNKLGGRRTDGNGGFMLTEFSKIPKSKVKGFDEKKDLEGNVVIPATKLKVKDRKA